MTKLSKKSLFLIAVALSAVFAFMLYRYLSTPVGGETVIVANKDILAKTTITADMVKEISVPKDYIQPNTLQDKKKVVGSITREAIVAGQQIMSRSLLIAGKTAGFTGIIPKDKRAMTVAVTEESGVAGFTKPGDYVDVIVTLDQQELGEPISKTILQNLQVLAYNRDVEDSADTTSVNKGAASTTSKTNTVTLAVNPMEAVQLALGDEKGKIRLALRPFMSADSSIITTTVTPTSLMGKQAITQIPTYNAPPVQAEYVSYEATYAPQAAQPVNKSIQTIRGTKVETISVN